MRHYRFTNSSLLLHRSRHSLVLAAATFVNCNNAIDVHHTELTPSSGGAQAVAVGGQLPPPTSGGQRSGGGSPEFSGGRADTGGNIGLAGHVTLGGESGIGGQNDEVATGGSGGSAELPEMPEIDAKTIGLWRVAARTDRLTLTRNSATGALAGAPYTGNVKQQFRLIKTGNATYRFELDLISSGSGRCLTGTQATATLGECTGPGVHWTLQELRPVTEERPALYQMSATPNSCLRLNGSSPPTLGPCDAATSLYIEPVGYGERKNSVEYEIRSLLLEKPNTKIQGHTLATLADDVLVGASISFREHVPVWLDRLTDGRVRWTAETIVSTDPITHLTEEGGNFLPSAAMLPADVSTYVPRGKYDHVAVFFTAGDLPGGWGWGPGPSPESNHTLWATVCGTGTNAVDWVSWGHEPTEVFIHEPMHGYDTYAESLGIPLPYGYLHGAEANAYAIEEDGWKPWYRDYWLGTVIGEDDTYRGFGPRLFREITPKEAALALP